MESLLAAAVLVMVLIGGALVFRQRADLARSKVMLTATLDNIAQGIVMLDPTGHIVVMNRQAADLFENGLQKPLAGSALAGDPDIETYLGESQTNDGRCLEMYSRKLIDGSAVQTYTDVTAIRANAAALATARDAAEMASRARADFLAVMSHEIRTPLNGILGVAGLLHDVPPGTIFGSVQRNYVNVISHSGEHLLQLINDILDFSKLDAGRLELEEIAFDLRSVIGSTIDLLASEAGRKGLSLTLDFESDVPVRASGDPGRLRQVLLNLVGNALKFTQAGSVQVAVRRISVERGALRLGVSVTDTGIGISPDGLERLFGEFVQGDNSISRRFGGSGLGLAISKRLAEQMGGAIAVQSRLGEGSTFSFDVLLRARRASDVVGTKRTARASAPPRHDPAATAPARALRVLVAEDNPTNSLVITGLVKRLGHSVMTVADGLAAVEIAGCENYDLILMDVMMPELDGMAATRKIRALPLPYSRVAIIGLTANAMPSEEEACLAAGMDGFATKPINAARLAAVIAQTVISPPVEKQGAGEMPSPPWFGAMPIEGENRIFDPAALDHLIVTEGDEATALVARFLTRAPDTLALLRTLSKIGDNRAVAHNAYQLAHDAARFGLMRAARVGMDMRFSDHEGDTETFGTLLHQGLDELRSWHRSGSV